jgi:hypothetical protein
MVTLADCWVMVINDTDLMVALFRAQHCAVMLFACNGLEYSIEVQKYL